MPSSPTFASSLIAAFGASKERNLRENAQRSLTQFRQAQLQNLIANRFEGARQFNLSSNADVFNADRTFDQNAKQFNITSGLEGDRVGIARTNADSQARIATSQNLLANLAQQRFNASIKLLEDQKAARSGVLASLGNDSSGGGQQDPVFTPGSNGRGLAQPTGGIIGEFGGSLGASPKSGLGGLDAFSAAFSSIGKFLSQPGRNAFSPNRSGPAFQSVNDIFSGIKDSKLSGPRKSIDALKEVGSMIEDIRQRNIVNIKKFGVDNTRREMLARQPQFQAVILSAQSAIEHLTGKEKAQAKRLLNSINFAIPAISRTAAVLPLESLKREIITSQ